MNACHTLTCFVVSLTLSQASFARLGETEGGCDTRYGATKPSALDRVAPILNGGTTKTYKFQGWTIRVGFANGVAVRQTYQKIPAAGVSPKIKDFELAAILLGEQTGGPWKVRTTPPETNPFAAVQKALEKTIVNSKEWVRTDGATATLIGSDLIVRLELPAAKEAEARAKQQTEQKQRAVVPNF